MTAKQVHFIFRDDLRKMNELKNEMKLLGRNHIDSAQQLFSYKESVTVQVAELTNKRKSLRYKVRSEKNETALATLKSEIAELSSQLGVLRREVKLCDSITARTADMKEKIRQYAEIRAKEQEKIKFKTKEELSHDQRRGRR